MSIGVQNSDTEVNGGDGSLSHARFGTADAVGQDSVFRILWRGRWMVVLPVVAAAVVAYVYLQRSTPLYPSETRLLIESPSRPALGQVLPSGGGMFGDAQTETLVIASRTVVETALRDPNVMMLPTFPSETYPIEKVIGTLAVDVIRNTNVVSITAESAYPDDTAQILNAIVRAYIRLCEANRRSITDAFLRDLNNRYDACMEQLEKARRTRLAFEKENPEVMKSVGGGIVSETMERLKQELVLARMNAVKQESFYEGLRRFESDPEGMRDYVQNVRPSAGVRENEEERARRREELSAIESRLSLPAKVGLIQEASQLEKRAAQIQKILEELDKAFVQNQIHLVKVSVDDAREEEKQLTSLYDQEFEKAKTLAGLEARYAFHTSECSTLQDRCDSLKKQIEDLDVLSNMERLNIHVLEKAVPATEPSSPQAVQVMAGALTIGLMAGAGLAFLREWRREGVHSADEIRVMLGAPVLGAVPSMAQRGFTARAQRLWLASGSAESEAYRRIRTALFFGAGQKTTTILVTSPDRMEGKTTLVSNLGIAMAQAGQKTLILDADLRKPMQHRAFAFKRHDDGLTDVLLGTIPLEKAIRPTLVPGLDILTGGGGVPNPSELLSSGTFARVLGQLQGMYDRILVDSPPVAMVTDAQILATYCSLTLLVLRAQVSSRMATQRARDALLTVNARLGGVILNDVPRSDPRYNYRGKYGDHNGDHGSQGRRPMIGARPVEMGPLGEEMPVGPGRG